MHVHNAESLALWLSHSFWKATAYPNKLDDHVDQHEHKDDDHFFLSIFDNIQVESLGMFYHLSNIHPLISLLIICSSPDVSIEIMVLVLCIENPSYLDVFFLFEEKQPIQWEVVLDFFIILVIICIPTVWKISFFKLVVATIYVQC